MKLDENLSPELAALARSRGHQADTVVEQGLRGVSDEVVFEHCCQKGRLLITLDLDFANPLRFPEKGTPGRIILRPQSTLMSVIRGQFLAALALLDRDDLRGKLCVVEPGRVRIHDSFEIGEED
ncbi:MAG: DUF5615 family PIN-like protein [Acidobacteriota bacterium]